MLNPLPLIPPLRFQIVDEGLFRGAFPSLTNYRYLRRLKLKTIVSLTPDDDVKGSPKEFCCHDDLRGFCDHEDIELVHFDVPKYSGSVMISQQLAAQVISLLIRPENLPAYIHCRDGGHNTGLVVMVLRRLQHWNLSTIFGEFTRHLKLSETISREEFQFIESFRAEIEIPARIPPWLWQGRVTAVHPTMQLKLLTPSPSEATEQQMKVDETNRRRQEIIEAIHQKGSARVETTTIRGLLLATDPGPGIPDRPFPLHVEGLGLEGLRTNGRKYGRGEECTGAG